MKRNGFTIIEILIVIAVFGILLAVGVPYMVYNKKKAQLSGCKTNLKTIANAIWAYTMDDNEIVDLDGVEVSKDSFLVRKGYLKGLPLCPVSHSPYVMDYISSDKTYFIECPVPENHFINPGKKCSLVKYSSNSGYKVE